MARFGLALILLVTSVTLAFGRSGYIGEGIQGRPHDPGHRAALRAYNFRHGFGYHVHRRHHRVRNVY